MNSSLFILADDNNGMKLVAAAVVAILWGIGAISGVMKKANEAKNRQTAIRRPPAAPPPMPSATARPGSRPAMAPIPPRRPQPMRTVAPFAQRRQVALPPTMAQRAVALQQMVHTAQVPHPAPPPIVAPARRAPVAAPDKSISADSQVTRSTVRSAGATAASVRRWLQPGNLRKQFILTELLQPSLALREPRE